MRKGGEEQQRVRALCVCKRQWADKERQDKDSKRDKRAKARGKESVVSRKRLDKLSKVEKVERLPLHSHSTHSLLRSVGHAHTLTRSAHHRSSSCRKFQK